MLQSLLHWSFCRRLVDQGFTLWSRQRLAQLDRIDLKRTQTLVLDRLIRRARHTQFGKCHDFARIRSPADFRRLVPVRTGEAFRKEWFASFPRLENVSWPGLIPFFTNESTPASGTSSILHALPMTQSSLVAIRRGILTALAAGAAHQRNSGLLTDSGLILGAEEQLWPLADAVQAGALLAILHHAAPRGIRPWLQSHLKASAHTSNASATFSWILGKQSELATCLGLGSHSQDYAKLKVILQIEEATHSNHPENGGWRNLDVQRCYLRPEGFFATTDPETRMLRVIPDLDIYFEFIPRTELNRAQPIRHNLWEVESGTKYAMAISTAAGLWAYIMPDEIQFESCDPPLFRLVFSK